MALKSHAKFFTKTDNPGAAKEVYGKQRVFQQEVVAKKILNEFASTGQPSFIQRQRSKSKEVGDTFKNT